MKDLTMILAEALKLLLIVAVFLVLYIITP